MKLLLALFVGALLSSCTPVESVQPVGATPVDFKAVPLEGTWMTEDEEEEVFSLVVKDPDSGTMTCFMDDEERDVLVRQTNGAIFLSTREKDTDHFVWYSLTLEKNRIVMRFPDPESFTDMVSKERVPGRIIEGEEKIEEQGMQAVIRAGSDRVIVDDPTGAWVKLLAAGKLPDPYDKERELTFRRIREPQR